MKKFEDLSVKEIESIIQETGSVKKAAVKLGVSAATIYAHRSKHNTLYKKAKQELQKEKADEEIGLIITNDPVTPSKRKTAKDIKIVVEDEEKIELRKQNDEMKKRLQVAEDEHEKAIKTKNDEVEKLKEYIERLKKDKQEAKEQQQKATATLNEQSRKQVAIMKEAEKKINLTEKANENIKKENIKLTKQIHEIEMTTAETISNYEKLFNEKKVEIDMLKSDKNKLHDIIDNLKQQNADLESKLQVVNKPYVMPLNESGMEVTGTNEEFYKYVAYDLFKKLEGVK